MGRTACDPSACRRWTFSRIDCLFIEYKISHQKPHPLQSCLTGSRHRQEEAAMLPAVVRPAMPRAAMRPVPPTNLPPLRAVRLLDQLRERVRMLHYSRRTEQAYLYWSRGL